MILYIVIGVIMLFLISSVKLSVINIDAKTDVLVRFGFLFYFHINYNAFIKFFSPYLDEKNKVSLKTFYENLRMYAEEKKVFKELFGIIKINEIELISKNNSYDPIYEQYINATSYILFSFIKEYLHNHFKKVRKERYIVIVGNKESTLYDFDFHVTIKIRIISTLYVLIKNIRSLPRRIRNFG